MDRKNELMNRASGYKIFMAFGLLILMNLSVSCSLEETGPEAGALASPAYFVAPDGADENPGTLESSWRTIAKANQELKPGDTLYIREGVYDEAIEPYNSGKPGKPITYTNYTDEEVIIRGQPGEKYLVAIGWSINGPWDPDSYIIVDGLTLSYGHELDEMRFEWVLIFGADSQHNVIRNCTIVRDGDPLQLYEEGYREWGVVLDGSKHNIIENNTIRGVNMGVHIKRAAQFNIIRDNIISSTGSSAIVIGSSKGVMQGNLIEGNIIERSAIEDGIQFMQDYDAADQETDVSNFGTIIRNNVIRYNAENAIDLKGAAHVVIEGNIIYGTVGDNNGAFGGNDRNSLSTITRGSRTSTRDVIIRRNVLYDNANGIRAYDGYKVYNNTIVANNRDYTGPNSEYSTSDEPIFWGLRQLGEQIAIQNNIFAGHSTAELALHVESDSTVYIDNNLYFSANETYLVGVFEDWVWQPYTLPEWQALLHESPWILGKDSSSLVGDPMFVDVPPRPVGEHTSFNFELRDDSPAIDSGGPITHIVGSGSGNQFQVQDAGYFFDGFGITDGDLLQIGGSQ